MKRLTFKHHTIRALTHGEHVRGGVASSIHWPSQTCSSSDCPTPRCQVSGNCLPTDSSWDTAR